MLETKLADTKLATGSTWLFGKVSSLRGEPDHWEGFSKAKPAGNKQTRTILRTVRNALAHGNIWTRENPIRELVFAREVRDKCPSTAGERLALTERCVRDRRRGVEEIKCIIPEGRTGRYAK